MRSWSEGLKTTNSVQDFFNKIEVHVLFLSECERKFKRELHFIASN